MHLLSVYIHRCSSCQFSDFHNSVSEESILVGFNTASLGMQYVGF